MTTATLPNLLPAIPDMFVMAMALITLLAGLFTTKHSVSYWLAQITMVVAIALTCYTYIDLDGCKTALTFHDGFILDCLGIVLKIFVFVITIFIFFYSRYYNDSRKIPHNEFYVLALLSVLGMMELISAHNLLTLFLGMELLSLPTYAMVAMRREEFRCVEAGMKYFIIGALASGMLLYGASMIFGATKSLDFTAIAQAISAMPDGQNLIVVFGLVFIVAGAAFKLGAAPFHMWVPDVYDGAPTSVTLFISTVPKIAAFAMLIRLLVDAMPTLHGQWQHMLIVVSILSMAIGNFTAIVQSNIKRMLAYSSIAHMGYMLLGLLCGNERGYAAALFYIITYSIMTLAAFGMVIAVSREGFEAEDISDFVGLNNRNPWLAFMMLLVMFSLASVPPLVGFIAKVGVLEALIASHFVWLAVLALLFSIVGAYYYIRIIKVMYFETPENELPPVQYSWGMRVAITINGTAVLIVGAFPGGLYGLAHYITF